MSTPNGRRLPAAVSADQLVRPHALLANSATGGGHHLHHHHHEQLLSSSLLQQSRHSQPASVQQQQQSRRSQQTQLTSGANSNASNGGTSNRSNGRGHQRRQSVARLLPDISKLRLLSWLVEASSELINCDIAIMDGVYARLNRSRESLLFWSQQQAPAPPPRPPAPSVQPVANKLVLAQQQHQQQQQRLKHKQQRRLEYQAARNHHSLPIAACSSSLSATTNHQDATSLMSMPNGATTGAASVCDNITATNTNAATTLTSDDLICDSNQDASDDDDDNSSAASSTTSSGIHGTSLSSGASDHSCASSSSSSGSSLNANDDNHHHHHQQPNSLMSMTTASTTKAQASAVLMKPAATIMSSAEQLSEKIRRTVMEHNYLQSLLVNVIRQHDRQRDVMNQQRKRQMSVDQFNLSKFHQLQQQRIDLADIADSLDDGCLCSCHSQPRDTSRLGSTTSTSSSAAATTTTGTRCNYRSSTLPASSSTSGQRGAYSSPQQQLVAPARKARRTKKQRNGGELNREDLINLLGDKLCENCFETHYWLHDCALELIQPPVAPGCSSSEAQSAMVARRNATFIKLVQQEVRSTLSKSIELIDLIRKEIKLPESIKQKQLMRCFSTSIQLLTSVGNYVVPSQDISSFIPEVGQSQTALFSLPSSDFDHLLFYPLASSSPNHPTSSGGSASTTSATNYHLAAVPDIPIRRRTNPRNQSEESKSRAAVSLPNQQQPQVSSSHSQAEVQPPAAASAGISDKPVPDSSSGASSNNSSASSSIARGAVQQSSLTRAQTSSAILDGKASHDGLSFEAIANLSRHGILFHQNDGQDDRPKFWQSSKFNFIKKLLHVKQERLARQQSKDRRIYNNKVQNKYRLVMMDLTHFNKSQTLLTTENGVNSLLTSMRNVLEFGLYLTLKLC